MIVFGLVVLCVRAAVGLGGVILLGACGLWWICWPGAGLRFCFDYMADLVV